MFIDLVASIGYRRKLDAEDWRDLVGGYLDEAAKAVTGFGGHVLKKLGDGLMALFAIRTHRRTMRSVRCAPHSLSSTLSPNSTRRTQRPACRSSLPASASKVAQSSSTRAERCLATPRFIVARRRRRHRSFTAATTVGSEASMSLRPHRGDLRDRDRSRTQLASEHEPARRDSSMDCRRHCRPAPAIGRDPSLPNVSALRLRHLRRLPAPSIGVEPL